ncbi:MAG: DUF1736 domain-containing protein, partial [Anaerolineae bacterium]|nr:DUF1736 domain-containing protein [Phycisphaerae bacterium]
MHAAFVVLTGLAILAAYSNSFGVKDRSPLVNWTLDNKYIIELDPRTKVEADVFRPSTWTNEAGRPDFQDIWTRDYWWPKGISGLYRPVVTFTYWLNWYKMSGDETKLDPNLSAEKRDAATEKIVKDRLLIFHIVNYWAHFAVTILVYLLALHLTQRFWTAVAIGLLFGLHPVATESVTNIIGRADIFASISVIGGLLLYIRSTLSRGAWKIPWLLALLCLTTVGVFSKESAVAILPVCILYDLVFRWTPRWNSEALFELIKNGFKWFITGYIVLFPPILAMFFVRSWVFANSTPPETPFLDNPIRGVNFFAGEVTALQVLARLWWILIFPKDLCADYSFNQVPTFGYLSTPWNNALGLLAAVLVISVFAYAIYLWKRNRAAAFFMLFFFLAFLPTSNLVITIGSIMAERFLYLPLVGFVGAFVLAIEWIVARVLTIVDSGKVAPLAALAPAGAVATVATAPIDYESKKPPSADPSAMEMLLMRNARWVAPSVLLVIALIYGVRTYYRNFVWQSDFTLWHAAKDISPVSFRSYQSYAFAIFEEVQKPAEKRQPETKNVTIDDCITWVSKGRPIVDQLPDRYNSSRLYLHEGMYCGVKGESLCSRNPDGSATVTPEAAFWFKRSVATLEKGRSVDRAFNEINRQKEIQRGKPVDTIPDAGLLQVYEYLGVSYFRLGDLDKALDNYMYMRHLDPWNADAYEKVASVYLQAGRAEQAAIALIQTVWLDGNRRHLWPVIERQLIAVGAEKESPLIVGPDGQPRLNLQSRVVQSLLCSVYQGFLRLFLEAKQVGQAEYIRVLAVRDLGFPQSLFDDIFKEFKLVPPPIPPKPGQPAPGTPAAPSAPTVPKTN